MTKQQIHRKKYSPNPETLVREKTHISEAELQRSTVLYSNHESEAKGGNPHGSNRIPCICTEHRLQQVSCKRTQHGEAVNFIWPACRSLVYYIDRSVLLENTTLVKFIRQEWRIISEFFFPRLLCKQSVKNGE